MNSLLPLLVYRERLPVGSLHRSGFEEIHNALRRKELPVSIRPADALQCGCPAFERDSISSPISRQASSTQNRRHSEHAISRYGLDSTKYLPAPSSKTDGQDLRRASRTNLRRFFYLWNNFMTVPLPSQFQASTTSQLVSWFLNHPLLPPTDCILAQVHPPHFPFHHAAETPNDVVYIL